jgi:hypothetical protein
MEEKYMPADGEPIDMSQFTLGEGYGSEQMYRDYPDLKPGDRVAFEKDGIINTDTVQGVTYSSPEWVAPPERSWWQRVVRRFTPARFRKPLPQSPPRPARVTVNVGDAGDDPLKRHQQTMEGIRRMTGGFDK